MLVKEQLKSEDKKFYGSNEILLNEILNYISHNEKNDAAVWEKSTRLQEEILRNYKEAYFIIFRLINYFSENLNKNESLAKLLTLLFRIKSFKRFTILPKSNISSKIDVIAKINYIQKTLGGVGYSQFLKELYNAAINLNSIKKTENFLFLSRIKKHLLDTDKHDIFYQYLRNLHFQYLLKNNLEQDPRDVLILSETRVQNKEVEYWREWSVVVSRDKEFIDNYFTNKLIEKRMCFNSAFDRYAVFYSEICKNLLRKKTKLLSIGGLDGSSISGTSWFLGINNPQMYVLDNIPINNENKFFYFSFHPFFFWQPLSKYTKENITELFDLWDKVNYINSDITKENINSNLFNCFDFIEANQILTHLLDSGNNILTFVRNIMNLIKSGGVVALYDYNFPYDYGPCAFFFVSEKKRKIRPLAMVRPPLIEEKNIQPFFAENFSNLLFFNADGSCNREKLFSLLECSELWKRMHLSSS